MPNPFATRSTVRSPNGMQPVPFPAAIATGRALAVPPPRPPTLLAVRTAKFVCAVTNLQFGQQVFHRRKGCVKVWDISASGVCCRSFSAAAMLRRLVDDFWRRAHPLWLQTVAHLIVGGEAATLNIWDLANSATCRPRSASSTFGVARKRQSRLASSAPALLTPWPISARQQLVLSASSATQTSPCGTFRNQALVKAVPRCGCWDLRESRQTVQQHGSRKFSCADFSLGYARPGDSAGRWQESSCVEVLNVNKTEKYHCTLHDSCVVCPLKFASCAVVRVALARTICLTPAYGPTSQHIPVFFVHIVRSQLPCRRRRTHQFFSCDISTDDKYIVTGSGDKKATLYEVMYAN
uniref:WD_REPEATS_REGION domain-containing protein n=1 Tax=Macrostomum lignano TaxID=282301 RepID=A0A1I8JSA3_9PLAT